MANPKEKTRKGLFGRTITVSKEKDEIGGTKRTRTVSRNTDKGVKTRTKSSYKNSSQGMKTKSKTRSFDSKEGVVYEYGKYKQKDKAGRTKLTTGSKYDRNIISGNESEIGSKTTRVKNDYGKRSFESPMVSRNGARTPTLIGRKQKDVKTKDANKNISQSRKMSRGRGYYGA